MDDQSLPDDETLRQVILSRVGQQVAPLVLHATAPILMRVKDSPPELIGSGIVVGDKTSPYLLTANHVLRRGSADTLLLGSGAEALPITGSITTVHSEGAEPGSDEDRADVSAIRLEGPVAEAYPADAMVPLSSMEFNAAADASALLIAGYPSSRHKKAMSGNTFTAATYNLLAHELDAAAYGEIGLARETTLAVASDKKDVWTTEGRRTAPNFNGMSGGGVWRLPTSGSAPLSAVTLAGIIIEHHQRHRIRHLVATRPSTILYFLAKRDQTLQSALAQIGVRVA